MNSSKDHETLKVLALNARQFSHSPYSHKKIGASILLTNGQTYSGCNIENASYGGTICAERVAILKAFSENTNQNKIKKIVVASDEPKPWPPCGMCLQVISEFAEPNTEVVLINLKGEEKAYQFKELFPQSFNPDHLLKKD